jgi:hypothetical protein
MERRTRRNHFSSVTLSRPDDLLHRNILLLRAKSGHRIDCQDSGRPNLVRGSTVIILPNAFVPAITGIAGCCARAASGQVTAALLRSVIKSRRFRRRPERKRSNIAGRSAKTPAEIPAPRPELRIPGTAAQTRIVSAG